MKNLKGIAVILSIALLAVGITACGGQDTSSDPGSETETEKQEEKMEEEAK